MPILATGILTKPPSRNKHSGFTLLEILVVLVIVGILVGAASLAIRHNPQRALQQEIERLQQVTALVQEQAILRAEVYGLRVEPTGYQFLRLVGQHWQALTEFPYQDYRLPVEMELALLDSPAVADAEGLGQRVPAEEPEPQPQIILFPSGEMTPFTLELHLTDTDTEPLERHQLSATITGELKLQLAP